MKRFRNLSMALLATLLLGLVSCNKKAADASSSDITEAGQQVGDVMASVDESGTSSGTISSVGTSDEMTSAQSYFERWSGEVSDSRVYPLAACGQAGEFSACSSNVVTRTFGNCTVGSATFSGTSTLTWGGSSVACAIQAPGDTITRNPNFTVTGLRGATLTISKTAAVGQRLTWSSGVGANKVFAFSNDGIRRRFTFGATTLFDYTTQTASDLTITGTSRTSRTLSGGTLRITNNSTNETCDVSPSSVSWDASTCNCARSGTWSGTCSSGDTFTLTITGCGSATIQKGTLIQTVVFDRCSGS